MQIQQVVAAATGLSLKAEWSDDLITWSGEGIRYEMASGDGRPLRMRAAMAKGARSASYAWSRPDSEKTNDLCLGNPAPVR